MKTYNYTRVFLIVDKRGEDRIEMTRVKLCFMVREIIDETSGNISDATMDKASAIWNRGLLKYGCVQQETID